MFTNSLSLVLLLMFLSVFLWFLSHKQQALNSGPPLLPKASPRGATRGPQCPGRGSRRGGQRAGHAQLAPARCLQGLCGGCPPAPPPLRAQGSPCSLGSRLPALSPLLTRPHSAGSPLAPEQRRAPWPGFPRRTLHTAPYQDANSPGS